MKNINTSLVILLFGFSLKAFAGGVGGNGGPPAREIEPGLMENTESSLIPTTPDYFNRTVLPTDILGQIKSGDLLKGVGGKTLIPLSEDAIRRLNIRASVTGSTILSTDLGERFILKRDTIKDRLIDIQKAAEVIRKAELEEAP